MRDGFVKVGCASPKVVVADPQKNKEEILELIWEMEKDGVKIMVFPELCLTAYTCQDLFWQRRLLDGAYEALLSLAYQTRELSSLIFVGLPLEAGGKLYNAAAALCRGEILGFVPKKYLPTYNEYYEERHFYGGEAPKECHVLGKRYPLGRDLLFRCQTLPELLVGCELCEDLWVPTPPSQELALAGATLIVNLSASDELVGKASYRRDLVRGQSARLLCAYAYASAGEGESSQDLVFGGHCMISENGQLLKESERFKSGFISSEVDVYRLVDERRRMSTFFYNPGSFREIPFELVLEKTPLTRSYPPQPFVPAQDDKRRERCEEILQIQAMGLKKRLEHVGSAKTIVGLSGGLDSTLALLVMAKATKLLGESPDKMLCVTMPCFGTTDRTYKNALALAQAVGARLLEVPIQKAVLQHFSDIGHDPQVLDVTYENSQARERTQVLMDLANQEGGILVGTGDLSELALGWATYNADHMSMYGVNASVPKTLVRHLVRYEADTTGDASLREVLLDILDTPVSPELLPPKDGEISQRTEDLVGPYTLHDFFLYYTCRQMFPPAKIFRIACKTFEGTYDAKTILTWEKVFLRRFFSQQYKRSCLPDGPKVGSVTLSPRGDLRMSSDSSRALWLSQLEELEASLGENTL